MYQRREISVPPRKKKSDIEYGRARDTFLDSARVQTDAYKHFHILFTKVTMTNVHGKISYRVS